MPGPKGVPGPGGVCPGGCLVLGGLLPGGAWSRGVCPWGVPGPGGPGGDPPPQTVTVVRGTHPTGMHSCLLLESQNFQLFLLN